MSNQIIKNFIKVSRGEEASYHTSYKQVCDRYGWPYRNSKVNDRIPSEYRGYKIEKITTGGSIDAAHLLHYLTLEPEVVVNGNKILLGDPDLEYTVKFQILVLGDKGPRKLKVDKIIHADGETIKLNKYEQQALFEYCRQSSVKLEKFTHVEQAV